MGFWRHEWHDHGSCSGMSFDDYFKKAADKGTTYCPDILTALRARGITPNDTQPYPLLDFRSVIENHLHFIPILRCKLLERRYYIQECTVKWGSRTRYGGFADKVLQPSTVLLSASLVPEDALLPGLRQSGHTCHACSSQRHPAQGSQEILPIDLQTRIQEIKPDQAPHKMRYQMADVLFYAKMKQWCLYKRSLFSLWAHLESDTKRLCN
ncbi:hypothetical protein Cgig2_017326 [Carnegiea gigantea]|uniref:Uncharacterized protein n=1 Tax=Carnegiea gigantea TaxID=171969 RepID=A0A9Q1K429_9CARY|nr:hypothetical protein Cgig2_017326 [Carnegiea gigantea]